MAKHRSGKAPSGDRKVYSAAAWWPYSDPSIQVIGLREASVKKEIFKAMREEERRLEDEGDEDQGGASQMYWSGVHAFSLKDVVSARELEEANRELNSTGIFYATVG